MKRDPRLERSRFTLCVVSAFVAMILYPAPSSADPLFAAPVTYSANGFSAGIAVGDLDGDGLPDIVTANRSQHAATLLFNLGDGSFGPPSDVSHKFTLDPTDVATGDLDGDGKADIAVVGQAHGRVAIFFGNGKGRFGDNQNAKTGMLPNAIALGDLDGDARLDIVTGNDGQSFSHSSVSVLLASGGPGRFSAPTDYQFGQYSVAVRITDLNHDAILDLVVGDAYGKVFVLLGLGGGQFGPAMGFDVLPTQQVTSLDVADFDGDGNADVAVARSHPFSGVCGVSVLLGAGDGTLGPASLEPAYTCFNRDLTAGDWNGDGRADLALSSIGQVGILLGNGDGTFANGGVYFGDAGRGGGGPIAAADVNADGLPDLTVGEGSYPEVSILLNTGATSTQVARPMVGEGQTTPSATAPVVSPNPIRSGGARLTFAVPRGGPVSVRLFDLAGRLVRTLHQIERAEPGRLELPLDRQGLHSGVYLYRIDMPGAVRSGRLVVMD